MKNLSFFSSKLFFALVIVCITFTLQSSSCSHDDASPAVDNTPVTGSWKVSFFYDSGNETSNFNGYSFAFNSGGALVATKGNEVTTGSWSQSSSKMVINFGSHALLSDLNKNWLIVEKSSSSIKLKDDSPASTEELQFINN